MNTEKKIKYALGSIATLILFALVWRQAHVESYRMSKITLSVLCGAIYAFMGVDILGRRLANKTNSNDSEERGNGG